MDTAQVKKQEVKFLFVCLVHSVKFLEGEFYELLNVEDIMDEFLAEAQVLTNVTIWQRRSNFRRFVWLSALNRVQRIVF